MAISPLIYLWGSPALLFLFLVRKIPEKRYKRARVGTKHNTHTHTYTHAYTYHTHIHTLTHTHTDTCTHTAMLGPPRPLNLRPLFCVPPST